MLGIVAAVLVVGALISAAGVALMVDLAGAAGFTIRHLTSKPPGYAATPRGLQVYGLVVLAIGLLFMAVALAASAVVSGLALLAVGLVAFGFGSVFAIRGEIATSRSLKR